jgi:hypothetical protein
LQQWFSFRWLPIGNLGVDLLVVPLRKLIGVELATKLVVMSIPPLTVAGMLWVAREVHNRLPPTVAFALPLAFGHPFMFGFVNFALSMALALLAFGFWLRLGELGKSKLRAILFVPISFIIFFAHTLRLGIARADVLFGRGGSAARPGLELGGRRSSEARCTHPSWRCRCC